MIDYPPAIQDLINALKRLPSVGPKSAERHALHLLQQDRSCIHQLIQALDQAQKTIQPCQQCGFFTQAQPCEICRDPSRDPALLCIVEHPSDILAFERSGAFKGTYAVLGGTLSPLDGIGPEQLGIPKLLRHIQSKHISEVIIGLSADVKGETTSLYLAQNLKKLGIASSRLATGLSVGTSLEYADTLTLTHALQDRKPL